MLQIYGALTLQGRVRFGGKEVLICILLIVSEFNPQLDIEMRSIIKWLQKTELSQIFAMIFKFFSI